MNSSGTVIVTGAARRVGRAIALGLAAHGHDIAIHCRKVDDDARSACAAIEALGRRATIVEADLADAAAVERIVPSAIDALGPIDALVNSASLFEYDDIETFDDARMTRHMLSNLAAPIALARALHRAAGSRASDADPACVVNILDNKLWNPNPDYLSYSCSKFALEGATRMLALALAPRVRVVGVAPGITLPSGPMTTAQFDAVQGTTPLGYSSRPEDIAGAVRFAIGNRAITGTTLVVDGGQHLWPHARDVLFAPGNDD